MTDNRDAIEAVVRGIEGPLCDIFPGLDILKEDHPEKWEEELPRIAALREPAVLEALCRRAADPKSGDVCWVGVTPQQAAEIVDAVLGAALGE